MDHQAPPAHYAAARPPLAGGFQLVPVDGPDARAALATALKLVPTVQKDADLSHPELVMVQRQVVAGMNYRVSFTAGPAAARHAYQILWYQDLKGKASVTRLDVDGQKR